LGFNKTSGTPQYFTYMASLDKRGGYQLKVKTTGLPAGTYQLLFRVAGEDTGSYHAGARRSP
jgi:hypothetical protein